MWLNSWWIRVCDRPRSSGCDELPPLGVAADAGVGSVVIVVMDPCFVGCGAFVLAGVGGGVGPFGGEGAVESLDLPVGLGPVGPGPFVGDVLARGLGERVGPVAGTVVGHRRGDPHARRVRQKGRVRAFPEPGRGLFAFIAEDLGVRDSGVVVHGVVQVAAAARSGRLGPGRRLLCGPGGLGSLRAAACSSGHPSRAAHPQHDERPAPRGRPCQEPELRCGRRRGRAPRRQQHPGRAGRSRS